MNENQADIKIVGSLNLKSTEALIRQQLAQIQKNINSSGGIKLKLEIDIDSVVKEATKKITQQVSGVLDSDAIVGKQTRNRTSSGALVDKELKDAEKASKDFSNKLKADMQAAQKSVETNAKQIANDLTTITKAAQELSKLEASYSGILASNPELRGRLDAAYDSIADATDVAGIQKNVAELKGLLQIQKQLDAQYTKTAATIKKKSADVSRELSNVSKVAQSLSKMQDDYADIINADSDLSTRVESLWKTIGTGADVSGIQDMFKTLRSAVQEQARLKREADATADANARNSIQMQNAYANARKISQLNPKMWSNDMFVNQFNDILSRMDEGVITGTQANAELSLLQNNLRAAGLAGNNFSQTFQNAINKFAQYISVSTIVLAAMNGLRNMVTYVRELDSAMVDLQIASGMTNAGVSDLIDSYHKLGQEMGATTIEVAKSADTWLRQGYSAQEANELIADSMMLSKLGQIEADEAAKALTSSMKGYGVAVEDATSIVDKFTAVDMAAATSAGDIATAMAETAVGADVAGVSMDRLVGYITQVAEVTQDAPESVGTFFRTLFARMGNIKAGRLIDPETEEDLSDVEATLNGMGIQLRDSNEEFRNFAEVLDEVAGKWDTMSSVQQRAIAVSFAGQRQQEKFLVLMEGYDQAMEYAAISTDSAGTATEKYGVYLDSIEAKSNAFKSATYDLADSLVDSDLVKNLTDIGTAGVNALTSLVDSIGAFPVAMAGLGLGALVKNFAAIRNDVRLISDINSKLKMGDSMFGNPNEIMNVAHSLGTLSSFQQEVIMSSAKLTDAQRAQISLIQMGVSADNARAISIAKLGDGLGSLVDSTGRVTVTQDVFVQALKDVDGFTEESAASVYNLVTAQNEASKSTSMFSSLLQRIQGMSLFTWVQIGITLFSTLFNVIQSSHQATLNAAKEAAQAGQEIQSAFDSLDDQVKQMQELQTSLESGNLSIEESANARAELMSIQDDIIEKFGVERAAIDGVTDSYVNQAAEIKRVAAEAYLAEYYKEIQAAQDYMTQDRAVTMNIDPNTEAFDELMDYVEKNFSEVVKLTNNSAFSGGNNPALGVYGTAEEQVEALQDMFSYMSKIRDEAASMVNPDEDFIRDLDNIISGLSTTMTDITRNDNFIAYSEELEAAIPMMIAANEEASGLAQSITSINEAVAEADSEADYDNIADRLAKARDTLVKLPEGVMRDALEEEVVAAEEYLATREFELKVKPEIVTSDDSYAVDARLSLRSASSFLGDLNAEELRTLTQGVDLYGAGYDEYSKKYQTGLNMLAKTAERYNITIEEAIDLMVELGLVTEETAEETAEEFKDVSDNIGESFAGSIQKIVSEGGDSLSQFQDAVDTALDWRSTTEEIQNALNVLEELSGIKIDPTSDDANDQLLLLQYYANGATESFYDLLDSELDALGIDISVDGIVGGIQEIINMAGNGVQSAATLLEILKALGAVTVTTKDNAYDTSDGHLLGIQTMNRIASGEIPRIEVTYTPNLEWAERLGNETRRLKDNGGGRRSSSSSSEREDTTDYWLEEYKALVAELDHQRNMDYISEQQYYDRLRELADKYLKDREQYIDEYRSVQEELWDYQKRLYEEQRDAAIEAAEAEYDAKIEALEAEQDAAEEALRNQIDLLDQELDAYRELIDERKRLLDDAANEREHDQRVEELNEEIANIQSELDAIALDDSAKANAQRVELKEQLLDAQKELEDEQYNWSVDTQKDALDKEYERYEKLVNDQQALLEQQINNLNLYYEQQIQMMGTMKDQMIASINAAFDQLLINVQTSLQETVIEVEEAAQQIESIFSRIYDTTTKTGVKELQAALVNQGYDIGNYGPNNDGIDGIIGKKTNKALVMAWQEYLNSLGANLDVDGIRGTKTKAAEKQFGVVYPYHTGGVVGKDISGVDSDVLRNIVPLDDNEVLAKLLNNELVLTEAQQEQVRGTFNRITDQFKSVADAKYGMANSIVTNNSPTVNVSNVFNGEVNSDTVRQLENWARKFKDDIKNNVFGTMNKHNVFSSKIPVRSY